jgi:hypothetical protein
MRRVCGRWPEVSADPCHRESALRLRCVLRLKLRLGVTSRLPPAVRLQGCNGGITMSSSYGQFWYSVLVDMCIGGLRIEVSIADFGGTVEAA